MQRIDERSLVAATKPGLVVLDTPELNVEAPPHLLDSDITYTARLYVHNTGAMPAIGAAELAGWTLTVDGMVEKPCTWNIAALRREFKAAAVTAVLDCAGHRRANGPVKWGHGAVGCVRWTGWRLGDLLKRCEPKLGAYYTRHHSPDLRPDSSGPALSSGLPLAKAIALETLIAFELNGAPIPTLHGGPLRLVVPGYPGCASQKWVRRIELRDTEHGDEHARDGHTRMPGAPLRSGDEHDPEEFEAITDIPVRSLITSPAEGFAASFMQSLQIRGHAWSGHVPVAKVELSFDAGWSWTEATLGPLPERFAWRRFTFVLDGPPKGDIEIIARATDAEGRTQPLESVPWNPGGYPNNVCHRVRGRIG